MKSCVAILQVAAELALQRLLRQIGDVRGHARHREAVARHRADAPDSAPAPIGIGHHRLPPDLVEGDVLRGMPGRRGDRHRREARGRHGAPPIRSTCMPPIEPPITQNSWSMPR